MPGGASRFGLLAQISEPDAETTLGRPRPSLATVVERGKAWPFSADLARGN